MDFLREFTGLSYQVVFTGVNKVLELRNVATWLFSFLGEHWFQLSLSWKMHNIGECS